MCVTPHPRTRALCLSYFEPSGLGRTPLTGISLGSPSCQLRPCPHLLVLSSSGLGGADRGAQQPCFGALSFLPWGTSLWPAGCGCQKTAWRTQQLNGDGVLPAASPLLEQRGVQVPAREAQGGPRRSPPLQKRDRKRPNHVGTHHHVCRDGQISPAQGRIKKARLWEARTGPTASIQHRTLSRIHFLLRGVGPRREEEVKITQSCSGD